MPIHFSRIRIHEQTVETNDNVSCEITITNWYLGDTITDLSVNITPPRNVTVSNIQLSKASMAPKEKVKLSFNIVVKNGFRGWNHFRFNAQYAIARSMSDSKALYFRQD